MTPPEKTEIELSIFGPGYGECCLLHLGRERWFVVDSCTGPDDEPVALSYLRRLGLDPSEVVEDILVSHWHDDHVDGVSRVFEEAEASTFHCSSALDCRELFQLLQLQRGVALEQPSGTDELAAVFDTLNERKPPHHRTAATGPQLVHHCSRLVDERVAGEPVRIWALSPSSADVHRARQSFAEVLQSDEETRRQKTPNPSQNHSSVVLLFEAGPKSALLGADRETTSDDRTGWSSILQSEQRPTGESEFFKVAHHGSSSGGSDDIWERLLADDPASIVTPHTPSNLPRSSDLDRLSNRTNELYCTAPPRGSDPEPTDRAVDKTMDRLTERRTRLVSDMGQVRIRFDLETEASPTLQTFGKAKRVER